ncbi:septum formation family protein [Nocardioides dongxiaopingii]|uniref:septum formation family protein n=1 Tax=Nocardioides sp. S-1144 TaxID=2582905 RepID=UPI0021CB0448|nr:septum formation family protein [Nocardioides sp. S-1144]
MTERRTTRARGAAAVAAMLAAGLVLGGCTSDDEPADPAPTSTPTPTPTAPPRATAAPVPADDSCYRLTYEQAVSPTAGARPVACRGSHTSETFAVGRIDNVVDGHLLAVDSQRVQDQVASSCPADLGNVVGGTVEDLRLSMLRAVWFTPSLDQAEGGASWYRCDVVALAGRDRLADVRGSLAGVLDDQEGRDRYGMCGTASPAARGFERVPCSAEHSWRAFEVVDLDPGDGAGGYPGRAAVTAAGEGPCEDAAAAVAEDSLDYEWAFEGPDPEQWAAGQTYIRCWSPD